LEPYPSAPTLVVFAATPIARSLLRWGFAVRDAWKEIFATQPIAGTQIFSQEARAASKEKVLDVTTRLVTRVRSALGDDASESSQQFAMASLSATSLDVVRREALRVVCPVDAVHGLHRFRPSELNTVPATVAKAAVSYSTGLLTWQGHSVGTLDDELLFHTLRRSLG